MLYYKKMIRALEDVNLQIGGRRKTGRKPKKHKKTKGTKKKKHKRKQKRKQKKKKKKIE